MSIIWCFFYAIYLINILYYSIRKKEDFRIRFTKKSFIVITGITIVLAIVLTLFYYPKEVLLANYKIQEISVEIYDIHKNTEERLDINSESSIEEFSKLLKGYKCRASINSGDTLIDEKTIFIKMYIYDGKRYFSYNMIIKEKLQRVYTAANIDFIYIIDNNDEMLVTKIFDYINQIKE